MRKQIFYWQMLERNWRCSRCHPTIQVCKAQKLLPICNIINEEGLRAVLVLIGDEPTRPVVCSWRNYYVWEEISRSNWIYDKARKLYLEVVNHEEVDKCDSLLDGHCIWLEDNTPINLVNHFPETLALHNWHLLYFAGTTNLRSAVM